MHRQGHIGMSLLLYAPAFGALGWHGYLEAAFVGLGIVFVTAMLPDKDQKIPVIKHRGGSHTLFSAIVIGAVVAAVTYSFVAHRMWGLALLFAVAVFANRKFRLVRHRQSHIVIAGLMLVLASGATIDVPLGDGVTHFAVFCGFAALLSIVAHLTADLLTPTGVKPFWPATDAKYTLNIAKAANPMANWLLFVLGVGATLSAGYVVLFLPT